MSKSRAVITFAIILLTLIVIAEGAVLFIFSNKSSTSENYPPTKPVSTYKGSEIEKIPYVANEEDENIKKMKMRTANFYTYDLPKLTSTGVLKSTVTTMTFESSIVQLSFEKGKLETFDGEIEYDVILALKVGDESYPFYLNQSDLVKTKVFATEGSISKPIELSELQIGDTIRLAMTRYPYVSAAEDNIESILITKL